MIKQITPNQVREILDEYLRKWRDKDLRGRVDWWKEDELSRAEGSLKRYAFTLNFLPPLSNSSTIVDLGTGYGHMAFLIKRLFGSNIIGVDSETPEFLKRRFALEDVKYITCDVSKEHLPLPDNCADMVLFCDSLHVIVANPKEIFLEINRVVKPGGFLVLFSPNRLNLITRIKYLMGKEQTNWKEKYPHFHHYSLTELTDLLEYSKFSIQEAIFHNYTDPEANSLRWGVLQKVLFQFYLKLCQIRPNFKDAIFIKAVKM